MTRLSHTFLFYFVAFISETFIATYLHAGGDLCFIIKIVYDFRRNKKVEAQPRSFYCPEIGKLPEILYNL